MYLKIDPQIHWDIRIFFGQKRVFQQPAKPRMGFRSVTEFRILEHYQESYSVFYAIKAVKHTSFFENIATSFVGML
jgi:hypothetical protein